MTTNNLGELLRTVSVDRNQKYSNADRSKLAGLLAANWRLIEPYSGTYVATWLLTDWNEPRWQTYAGNKTRKVNGKWTGTLDINWHVQLPDGRWLTDDYYSVLLETCKRAAFLYREGKHGKKFPALSTWRSFCLILLSLCRWLVLQAPRYRVAEHGMGLLDQAGLRQLFAALGRDSWTGALCITERVLDALHSGAFGRPCPEEILAAPHNLPPEVRDGICRWLHQVKGYSQHHRNAGNVSRRFIANLISVSEHNLLGGSLRFSAVLRQFEPRLAGCGNLLLSSDQNTEHPGHRTPKLTEALSATSSPSPIERLSNTLSIVCMLYRHIPHLLPDPASLDLSQAQATGLQHCASAGHTPFIPLDIGLRYLNEAIRWIHCYGDALVDYYLAVAKRLSEYPEDQRWKIYWEAADILNVVPVPEPLRLAGFRFPKLSRSGQAMDFEAFRRHPTLHQAVQVWAGAVVILIAIFKPSRDTEICHLPRNCLLGSGPYWLDSQLAKRTVREHRSKTDGKAIPTITARAIQQLQRLGEGLVKIYGPSDGYTARLLFYLPDSSNYGAIKQVNDGMLNQCLDRFCDFVALPPDSFGRRWYIRVHEMRKWFLLLLFWSGRFGVLDAAREMAGHVDVEHLYAYIEREFPGASLSKLEAEFAADRLRQFDRTRTAYDGETGLNDLYERVLNHFSVSHLEMVPEREWESYVETLRNEEAFHLEPYTIFDNKGYQRITVAFRSVRRNKENEHGKPMREN